MPPPKSGRNSGADSDVRRAGITASDGCRPRSQAATRVKRCAAHGGNDSGKLPVIGDSAERLYAQPLTKARDIVAVADLEVLRPVPTHVPVIPCMVVGNRGGIS